MGDGMMVTVDGNAIDRVEALRALYAASKPQGMGFIHFRPGGLTRQEAEQALSESSYIDYLRGRVIKVDFEGELSFRLYDRDNGPGAGMRAVSELLASDSLVNELLERSRHEGSDFKDDAKRDPFACNVFVRAGRVDSGTKTCQVFVGKRGSGKTTALLRLCDEINKMPGRRCYIVVADGYRASILLTAALDLGFEIPSPVPLADVIRKRRVFSRQDEFLFDDVKDVLERLVDGPVRGISVNREEDGNG